MLGAGFRMRMSSTVSNNYTLLWSDLFDAEASAVCRPWTFWVEGGAEFVSVFRVILLCALAWTRMSALGRELEES
jgi:hypothetical protein